MATLSQPIAVTGTTTPEEWFEGTTSAAGPADAGSLTLTVVDPVDFDESGGFLTIGDETHTYIAVDDDTGLITLEAPLTASYAEGERVDLYPRSLEKFADVMVGDHDEAQQVEIPHELWNKIADGIREDGSGEVVDIAMDGDTFVVTEIHGQAPIVDGGYLDQETTPPETFMDGSLYGTVGFVDGGFVAGDPMGANVSYSAVGITADNADGERTFQVDSLTGNVTTVGLFASSLVPNEAHVVMGDLAGTGSTRTFVKFYTGAELNADGTPVTDAFPGEVSSGVDTDSTRYIKLRSPDLGTVHPGELTVRSSVDLATRPVLGWSGDIRLRGDKGIVYALDGAGARTELTIDGAALVLSVPNGTMRLADNGAGANRLRSRDSADTARRHLEMESDTLMFDVTGGNLVVRGNPPGATGAYGQMRAYNGNVALVWSGNDVISVTNTNGGGYQPIAASAFNVNSDAANKKAETAVDPAAALAAVNQLAVYDYTRTDNDRKQRGLMAQDVAQVLPMAVDTDDNDSQTVELYALISTVAAATQALTTRVEALEPKGQVKK